MTDKTANPAKLALVISNLSHGGAERQIVELAKHLHSELFDVSIICLSDNNPLLEKETELKERVLIVPKRTIYDIALIFKVALLLRQQKIDIVHGFLFDAELVSRLAGWLARTPIVIGSERNSNYHIGLMKKSLLKLTGGLADKIIANSRNGAMFNQSLYRFAESKYRVVHNGVDTIRFYPQSKTDALRQSALDIPPGRCILGMFASFKRQKNHPLLFAALKEVQQTNPNFTLLLVGDSLDGDFGDTQQYKKEALAALENAGLGNLVVMLGQRNDIEELYSCCDFTVLSSNHEGMPNVVLESMACGVPVIATDVADNRLLIRDQIDGLLVPVGNKAQLASAILKMMADQPLRKAFGQAARESIVEQFSNQMMVKNMQSVYSELLGKVPPGSRLNFAQ